MVITNPKYRGTPIYTNVRNMLVKTARAGKLISYGEIAEVMGLPPRGYYMSRETGIIAGEISEAEHAEGRPMLTAILVRVTDSEPGPGFYKLARMLGRGFDDTTDGRQRFWQSELRAVHDYWRDSAK